MPRIVSNDLLTDIWLCMARSLRCKIVFRHISTTPMTMNAPSSESIVYSVFFNLFFKTLYFSPSQMHIHSFFFFLSFPSLSYGVLWLSRLYLALESVSRCVHWIRNLFLRWNLFRYDFSMDFFLVFNVIFVGTAGANVVLLRCFILLNVYWFHIFFLPFLFVAIDLNGRTSGYVHILTF